MVVSAQAANEEVFLLREIASHLGAQVVGVSWSPADAFADDFLIKADKNPNTAGLRAHGLGGDVDAILAAVSAGTVQALVLHRADLTGWRDAAAVRAALETVPYLVVLDTDQREVAQFADVVLPLATYLEGEGTFTNAAGRVQRFRAAFPPPGDARVGWLVLTELEGRIAGAEFAESADAVFARASKSVPAFAGLGYDALGEHGRPSAPA